MSTVTCPTCNGTGKMPDTREAVRQRLEAGEKQADIARALDVSRARVSQIRRSLIERGELGGVDE